MSFGELLTDIWRARRYVIVGVFAACLIGALLIASAVPHQRASLLLAPSQLLDMQTGRDGARGKSGLASGDVVVQEEQFTRFMAVYSKAGVATLLLRDQEIVNGLSQDKAFLFSGFFGGSEAWSPAKLAKYIEKRVTVDQVGETSLRALRYSHPDGEFAAQFLSRLHTAADGIIRYGARKEIAERISYLNEALMQAQNPDNRRALADLLMEQERTKMLISIDQPYAAAVVEKAYAESGSYWPNVPLVMVAAVFAGALFGYAAYGFRHGDSGNTLYQQQAPVRKKEARKMRDWVRFNGGHSNDQPQKKSPLPTDAAAE